MHSKRYYIDIFRGYTAYIMKKVNVNKIFVLDRCKYFDQVHLITLVTEHSMVKNNKERHNAKSR